MYEREARQADQLEAYRRALADDPRAAPPDDLDAGLVTVAQLLERELAPADRDTRPPSPEPEFTALLQQRLAREAERRVTGFGEAVRAPRPVAIRPQGRRAAAWLGLAAVLVLALAGVLFWTSRPGEVSAREIVERAKATAVFPGRANIRSFAMSEATTANTSDGVRTIDTNYWYQAPDRWRIETVTAPARDGAGVIESGLVTDGETVWRWTGDRAQVQVSEPAGRKMPLPTFGGRRDDINAALQSVDECADSRRREDDTVAGRPTYVIDLGASLCPSASMPETNGRRLIWVDKGTFFILKSVQYDGRPEHQGDVFSTTVVTNIDYNVDLADDRFAYETPAGQMNPATEMPGATQPAAEPTARSMPADLAGFRARVSFPVFVPTDLPAGLTPAAPVGTVKQPGQQVRIVYYTSDGSVGLSVFNGPAGCCLAATDQDGTLVTLPNGARAHYLTADPTSGTGTLWWEQDGAYIAIEVGELDLTRDTLLGIAASMSKTAEPGETAPPPTTQQPATTAAVEGVDFPILRPSWLPEPMEVDEEPRSDGRGGTMIVLQFDHRSDDEPHAMLSLMEQKAGAGVGGVSDPRATVEQIGGREVTVVHRGDACTMLSWRQDGVFLSLGNAYDPPGQILYSCEQMRRIAASVEAR